MCLTLIVWDAGHACGLRIFESASQGCKNNKKTIRLVRRRLTGGWCHGTTALENAISQESHRPTILKAAPGGSRKVQKVNVLTCRTWTSRQTQQNDNTKKIEARQLDLLQRVRINYNSNGIPIFHKQEVLHNLNDRSHKHIWNIVPHCSQENEDILHTCTLFAYGKYVSVDASRKYTPHHCASISLTLLLICSPAFTAFRLSSIRPVL